MLITKNLTKRYGSITALDRVSLTLEPGEFFGLLGPNGAGKTTLMSLVAGLRPADEGEILLEGEALRPGRIVQRLLSAPVRRTHILWSKDLFGMLVGVAQLAAFFVAGHLLFWVDITSLSEI